MRWISLMVLLVGGSAGGAPPAGQKGLAKLAEVARGLEQPVALVAPGDGSGRLFIVEKVGRVRIFRNGKVEKGAFLDVNERVSTWTEQGLLGLAFHPQFKTNGRFYLNFTDRKGDTRVVERKVGAGTPDRADPAWERQLLFVAQPYKNHNGGHVLFGPDGKLWVGMGDGGAANDPQGNGQNRTALLAKMLRIDVEAAKPAPEIVLYGLRNPWRYSFDRRTGDLYIADVGQDKWEEVHVLAAGSIDGKNLGWNVMEGTHCLMGNKCPREGLVMPVIEYDHKTGCSITGGIVYRGKALPELEGVYFYSDFCTAIVRSVRWKGGKVEEERDWRGVIDPENRLAQVSSFGEDEAGEMYLLSLEGVVWKLVRR